MLHSRLFHYTLKLIGLLAVLQTVAAAETNRPPDAVDLSEKLKSFSQSVWDQHLVHEMSKTETDPATSEWACRAALRKNPLDTSAVTNLVRSYMAQHQFMLAAAASEYALAIGQKEFTPTFIYFRKSMEGWLDQELGTISNLSRLETLLDGAAVDSTDPHPPEYYSLMTKELRKILPKPGAGVEILKTLASLHQKRNDLQMVGTITSLLMQLAPKDEEVLGLHFNFLQDVDQPVLYRYYIQHYSRNTELARDYNAFLGEKCLNLGMKREALLFLKQWTDQQADHPKAWELLGRLYMEDRAWPDAWQSLVRAAQLPGHDANTYLRLAQIAARKPDAPAMILWLTKYQPQVDGDAFVKLLSTYPFRSHPRLLKEFEVLK